MSGSIDEQLQALDEATWPTSMVVPDGVEPLEQWRAWYLTGEGLWSLNRQHLWKPGEWAKAHCDNPGVQRIVMCPLTDQGSVPHHKLDELEREASGSATRYMIAVTASSSVRMIPNPYHAPPKKVGVVPPPHHGWKIVTDPHIIPEPTCSCGFYAAQKKEQLNQFCDLTDHRVVFGKVKLWGRIVPGTIGARAEYAYPSELHTTDPSAVEALKVYGVPVHLAKVTKAQPTGYGKMCNLLAGPRKQRSPLYWPNRALLGAALFNVAAGSYSVAHMLGAF